MTDIFTLALIWSTIRLSTPLDAGGAGRTVFRTLGRHQYRARRKDAGGRVHCRRGDLCADTRLEWARSPWVGLLAGMLAGLLIAAIHAVSLYSLQSRSGCERTAINILMIGMPGFLSGAFFLSSGSTPQIPKDHLITVDRRSSIAFALVPITWYVLYKTPFGLRLRSVGENPEAADAAGVSVARMRYAGVLLSGVLAGIGGAYLSIGQSSLFTRNMTSGRGFIALAALIFGKWRPVQTMLACLLFGFTEAISIQMQGVVKLPSGEDIPVQFIQMVPYVLTIVVLAGFIGSSRPPRALGIPYQKEKIEQSEVW